MPGVAPEEDTFAGLDPADLTGLRICNRHDTFQHMEKLVGTENRPMMRGMAEGAMRLEPENESVDVLARYVDPIRHLPRLRVAPKVPYGRLACD